MLGNGENVIQYPEKKIKLSLRRSIVARHDIKKGKILSWRDLTGLDLGGVSLQQKQRI